ncbi:hypothetical protein Ssi03_40230 [Sphaerisporangium siamense]|nr:hypothetical protein Ssi03_40230 [Sphaerisporangium siamense]
MGRLSCIGAIRGATDHREEKDVYKEFAVEVVMWLIPIIVLIGLALMVTSA